jgi:hypothetical protein
MRVGMRCLALAGIVLALSAPVLADDLTGKNTFLCSGVAATRCIDDGECTSAPLWTFNLPHFVIIDLKANMLSTTEASGENRTTPIKHIERQEGAIYLQGLQNGRAFSFVIVEETGFLSVAIAADGMTLSVFGACTPTPAR